MSSNDDGADQDSGTNAAEASDTELLSMTNEKQETFFDQVMELIYTVGTGEGFDGDSDDDDTGNGEMTGEGEASMTEPDLDFSADARHEPGSSNVFLPFDPLVPGNLPGHEYALANTSTGSGTDSANAKSTSAGISSGSKTKKFKKFSPFRKKSKASDNKEAEACADDAGGEEGGEEGDGEEIALPTENYVSRIPANMFSTRKGPNYARRKEKAPSAPALMELMSVDYVRTTCRVPEVGSKLNIPADWTAGIEPSVPGVPPLFIVNAQVPYNWPTSLFTEVTDGPCYAVILIFRLTKETVAAMKDLSSAAPAVRLFARYCSEAPEAFTTHSEETAAAADASSKGGMSGRFSLGALAGANKPAANPWSGRAKLCIRCENLDELGLPGFLQQYNSKPVLIRESGTLIRGSNYVELSVNVRKFGMLANNTLPMVHSRTNAMVLSVGFCIEAREEEEMPEGLFGCCQGFKITSDPDKVPFWFATPKGKGGTATVAH